MRPPLPLSALASSELLMAVVVKDAAVEELLGLFMFLCVQKWAGNLNFNTLKD